MLRPLDTAALVLRAGALVRTALELIVTDWRVREYRRVERIECQEYE